MKRLARLMSGVGLVAGIVGAYVISHPHVAPAMQMYHEESSVRAVHTSNGYRLVKAPSAGAATTAAGQSAR